MGEVEDKSMQVSQVFLGHVVPLHVDVHIPQAGQAIDQLLNGSALSVAHVDVLHDEVDLLNRLFSTERLVKQPVEKRVIKFGLRDMHVDFFQVV